MELANKFPSVCIRGEVTNLGKPGSGHWYFSLKDKDAQIRLVMFRSNNLKAHQIKEGEVVIACGKPGIYRDRGDLQLIVSHLQLAGTGDLQKQFEELKKQLQEEGYFGRDRKKEMPKYPRRVAVITSVSGAVVHDIQTVTNRRAPVLPIWVIPSNVQGHEAIDSIVQSIAVADKHSDIELILLARGGGSLEDFAAFNSPEVAGAIIGCKTPLLCAVGHESDISIADLVADSRAATPSEAAEMITEGYVELGGQFEKIGDRLNRALRNVLDAKQRKLALASGNMRNPIEKIRRAMQRLDSLEPLLESRAALQLKNKTAPLLKLSKNLDLKTLVQQLAQKEDSLMTRQRLLLNSQRSLLEQTKLRFARAVKLLDATSPLAILSRGYGITTDRGGHVIYSAGQVSRGQTISTKLGNGSIDSKVVKTIKD